MIYTNAVVYIIEMFWEQFRVEYCRKCLVPGVVFFLQTLSAKEHLMV